MLRIYWRKGRRHFRNCTDLNQCPAKIKLHLVKAFLIPILYYPPIPLVNLSKKKKLQDIQNKGLRFAFNQKYPFTKNTRTLHSEANIEPLNYNLYHRSKEILKKTEEMEVEQMIYIKDNYEIDKKHPYFPKTKITTNRGPPQKIYTNTNRPWNLHAEG